MAVNGGTLLYGVAEDEAGRLMAPKPCRLAGAPERIDQVVQTNIAEAPQTEVHDYRLEDDPDSGYLFVEALVGRAAHRVRMRP